MEEKKSTWFDNIKKGTVIALLATGSFLGINTPKAEASLEEGKALQPKPDKPITEIKNNTKQESKNIKFDKDGIFIVKNKKSQINKQLQLKEFIQKDITHKEKKEQLKEISEIKANKKTKSKPKIQNKNVDMRSEREKFIDSIRPKDTKPKTESLKFESEGTKIFDSGKDKNNIIEEIPKGR